MNKRMTEENWPVNVGNSVCPLCRCWVPVFKRDNGDTLFQHHTVTDYTAKRPKYGSRLSEVSCQGKPLEGK